MKITADILNKIRSVHFIGIGGIGMCGLAEYMLDTGYKVSGSDMVKTKITERLERKGAKISYEQTGKNINSKTGLCVYTSAVKNSNPEFKKAKELKIPLIKRAALLGMLVNDNFVIGVAGTHGKTTTTSMLAKILMDARLDPLVFVGGNLDFLKNSAYRNGKSGFAIVEADEYDRSFHTLRPDIAIINNVELDHTDIYKSKKDIIDSFRKYTSLIKADGYVVMNSDDKNMSVVSKGLNETQIVQFGFNGNNKIVQQKNIENKFTLNDYEFTLGVPGKHNIYNASAAIIAASLIGVKYEAIKKTLKTFGGVQRRLELKLKKPCSIYDDYAHHPTEIKYSLNALKNIYKKVIVIFEPHTFTRVKEFYKEFAQSLSIADKVFLLPIYPARELPIEGISSEKIFKELNKLNKNSILLNNNKEIFDAIIKDFKKDTCIVFQGAGTITNFCEEVIKKIKGSKK